MSSIVPFVVYRVIVALLMEDIASFIFRIAGGCIKSEHCVGASETMVVESSGGGSPYAQQKARWRWFVPSRQNEVGQPMLL